MLIFSFNFYIHLSYEKLFLLSSFVLEVAFSTIFLSFIAHFVMQDFLLLEQQHKFFLSPVISSTAALSERIFVWKAIWSITEIDSLIKFYFVHLSHPLQLLFDFQFSPFVAEVVNTTWIFRHFCNILSIISNIRSDLF